MMISTIRRVDLQLLLITAAFFVMPTRTQSAAVVEPSREVHLEIPDVGQEKRRPNEGWCGESSIQMALAYCGAYASQKAINRAGKPKHPDLYSEDLPVAMSSLGLEYKQWRGDGVQPFLKWVRDELAAGHPVLIAVKIYPTAHPDWNLDHFVLVTGCTKNALTLNDTWGNRESRSNAQLMSKEKGLSLINRQNTCYGYSILGWKSSSSLAGLKPTRIQIHHTEKRVELRVTAENLKHGRRYRLVKFTDLAIAQKPDARGIVVRSFVADGPRFEIVETIGLDDARLYRCIAEP
jgi:hypothetical protein